MHYKHFSAFKDAVDAACGFEHFGEAQHREKVRRIYTFAILFANVVSSQSLMCVSTPSRHIARNDL